MRKRQIPPSKQLRNVGYLAFIGLTLLASFMAGKWYMWMVFIVTAYYFWPQGHYGTRGVK